MELFDSARGSVRQTWLLAIALIVGLFVMGAPVVQAAAEKVKVVNTVDTKVKNTVKTKAKVKDTDGDEIESQAIPDMGLFGAEGSDGAVAVRNFAGGTGLIATGDCTEDTATSRPNTSTIPADPDTILTAIIVTGTDAEVEVRAPDLDAVIGPFPVARIRANAANPNAFIGLGNGLTVTPSELVFTCTAIGGGDPGNGDYVILGQ